MDREPPLPASDNPFVVLGVGEHADEAMIKRAYAQLLRRYRPDRYPDEFARIHAAFEEARARARGDADDDEGARPRPRRVVSASATGPSAEGPAPTAPAPPPAPRPALDPRVAERLAAGEFTGADLAEVAAADVPPLELFDRVPEARHRDLFASPSLGWGYFRRVIEADPAVASALARGRFETLTMRGEIEQLWHALDDHTLREDSRDLPSLAYAALSALPVIAWRGAGVRSLVQAWSRDLDPTLHGLLDVAEGHMRRAQIVRERISTKPAALRPAHAGELPEAALVVICDLTALGGPARAHVWREAARLLRDPARWLALCDRVASPAVADVLVDHLGGPVDRERYVLTEMDPARREALARRMVELNDTLRHKLPPWALAAGAGLGVAGTLTGIVPGLLLAGAAGGVVATRLGGARERYLKKVRPGIAAIGCDLGLPADAIRAWLTANSKVRARALETFDIAIDEDPGLAIACAFAARVRAELLPELAAGAPP